MDLHQSIELDQLQVLFRLLFSFFKRAIWKELTQQCYQGRVPAAAAAKAVLPLEMHIQSPIWTESQLR